MKINAMILILCAVLLNAACATLTVDHVAREKELVRVDALYIGRVEIKSDEGISLDKAACSELSFALKKKNYKVKTYLDAPDDQKNFKYIVSVKMFINNIGTELDRKESASVFCAITDSATGEDIANIRVAAQGLNMRGSADQAKVFDAIASRIDTLVRGF